MWMQRGRLPGRQRGSIILPAAAALIVCLILLGSANLGYLFYVKRELQNAADLAALSGVQYIHSAEGNASASCENAQAQARLAMKGFFDDEEIIKLSDADVKFVCGTWNIAYAAPEHFAEQTGVRGSYNALKVVIDRKNILPLMPFASAAEAHASAIAKSAIPVAAFQVGSQLLRLDDSALLGGLLSVVGLNVDDLRLLDSDGLASAKISPSGLLGLLGVDLGIGGLGVLTPDGVANIDNLTLLNILDASIAAVNDNTLKLNIEAIKRKLLGVTVGAINLLDVVIPLGGGKDDPGLFAFLGIGRDDPLDAALDVQLGIGDILKTAIAIGANGHAVEIPQLNLLGIKAQLTIVEPPTIAIGPVGTIGYSAQVRLALDVDTNNIPIVNVLLKLLDTRVHLPIAVDVTSATAELTNISCSAPPTIDLSVDSRIANLCVGRMLQGSVMSHTARCEDGLQEESLIRLLGVPLLSGKLHVPALRYIDDQTGLGMRVDEPARWTKPQSYELFDTVDNLVVGLLNLLSGLFREPEYTPGWDGTYTGLDATASLVERYLDLTKDGAGFYNVNNITQLVLSGSGEEGTESYVPALLKENFRFSKAIPTTCLLVACSSEKWKEGSFSEAFHFYTSVPMSLIDIIGIPTFNNGYRSCAGLLSSLLGWNSCVKHNLTKLLKEHPQYLVKIDMDAPGIQDLLNPEVDSIKCNGALCHLLRPVLGVLKPVLNGVGHLLRVLLDDVLGLELGRTEIKALDIQCEPARLVY